MTTPKSTNMISMTHKPENFLIDSSYVDDIEKLNSIYNDLKPDVLLIDSTFDKKILKKFLLDFQKKNHNNCKIIMTFKEKKDKIDFAKTKVPARFFPYKVPSDILFASFKEMSEGIIFSNNDYIYELIENLNLNLSSPIIRQFRDCLEILTCNNSKYLLFGYLYNAFYTVSKLEDVRVWTQ